MILILEGTNGTGKSTCAKLLSPILGAPVYRPFRRGNSDLHWGSCSVQEKQLREQFKVPLNTHIEDLYVADLISTVETNIILDRSIPSAISYGLMEHDPLLPNDTVELFFYWQKMLLEQKALYVWMTATYDTARKRSINRIPSWWPINREQYDELESTFSILYSLCELSKLCVNTENMGVDEVVETICQHWTI